MDTSLIWTIAIVVGILVFLTLVNYQTKKRIMKMLKAQYGNPSDRKYDERDFNRIRQFFDIDFNEDNATIDNTTWNDLQMNTLYGQINNCNSTIGDEYLYRHLRKQQYEKLDQFESHIQYFENHPEIRLKLQYAFYKIKKTGHNDYIKHLNNLDSFPKVVAKPMITLTILGLLSILFFFFTPDLAIDNGLGVFPIIICLILSLRLFKIFAYKTSAFFKSIFIFTSSVGAAKKINLVDSEIFSEQLQKLNSALKPLQKKSRLTGFLVDVTMMGNRAYAILTILCIYFNLYVVSYFWIVSVLKKHQKEAIAIYESIGYFELCMSLASYRQTLTYYCHPEFGESKEVMFEDIYHPLIKKPVANTKTIESMSIITGANASGKTTFTKTIALNVIVGQTINTCFCKRLVIKPANVYTSMNIEDNIIMGDSFYMAEIKRLKILYDRANQNNEYTMIFIDELLKGTNTIERIAAASTILRQFAQNKCFLMLTTHDTELTIILKNYFTNYHFKEETSDDEIFYDYKLYDGVTTGSNAIALLRVCHYDQEIVLEAAQVANDYRKQGVWEVLT